MLEFPKQFSLSELTRSSTAARLGIDNVPKGEALENLHATANYMLKVRKLLGNKPITVNSGYRSPELNKHIPGSSNTSAHTLGWAVDFTCKAFGTPLEIANAIADSKLMDDVDQLIHEYDAWVHISFDPRNRKQKLTINKSGTHSATAFTSSSVTTNPSTFRRHASSRTRIENGSVETSPRPASIRLVKR